MLYECPDCGHKVAFSARSCPSCGAAEPGHRAFDATPLARAWQEQAAKRRDEENAALRAKAIAERDAKAAEDRARSKDRRRAALLVWFIIAVLGSVWAGVPGLILGFFVGLLVACLMF